MVETIEDLINALKTEDDLDREAALGELEIRSEESLDALIEALNNRNKNIRRYSAQALGYIGNEKAIQPLINTLEDKNKFVRREASTGLVHIGEPAFDSLIEILDHEDWRVRGGAAWALGSMKKPEALDALNALLDDESGFVKAGAKNAIANIEKGN